MNEWLPVLIQQVGAPVVGLGLFAWAVWRAICYTADKLLDDEKGVVVLWLKAERERNITTAAFNAELIGELKSHNTNQIVLCEKHGNRLVDIAGGVSGSNRALAALIDTALAHMQTVDTLENGEKRRVEELLIQAKTRLTD
jgi:hypothetical protein